SNVTVMCIGTASTGASDWYVITGGGGSTLGTQDVWIPARAMDPRATNGAEDGGKKETSTNKVNYSTWDFDTTTQEFTQFMWQPPRNYNNGTVKFTPYWTAGSGSGGVVWACQGVAISNDDPLDSAFGTEQTSTDTFIVANDVHVGPQSSAITIAGTPADSDLIIFQVKRNPSDASDTLGVDAQLIGVMLEYTIDSGVTS
ncbi:MAG: hypothetical protein ACKO7N_09935, partial [Candidatus Nitrosotenuis sp.]